jgi:hypothetical protein
MYFRAIAGLVAGLCAGVISGIMFLLMQVPEGEGLTYSVLAQISRALGSPDPAVGWSYHLFNSAITGIVFGLVVGKVVHHLLSAVALGLVASLASWALANVVLLPKVHPESLWLDGLGTPLGLATLIGYTVMGVLLGVIFLWVYNPIRAYDYSKEAVPEEEQDLSRAGSPPRA